VGDDGGNDGAGEGAVPSERVRKMEIRANEAFDVYRELYYEGGVSSVYFWNLDDGFAGVVLLKKGKPYSCCISWYQMIRDLC
jgi:capping protein beta